MSVEIRLPPTFQVLIQENEYLELPIIQLVAAEDNVPHIARINCVVTGTPESVALKIKRAYKPFDSVTPRISQIGQLEQYPCKLDQILTEPINCNLTVSVEYFDSDAAGEPIISQPKEIKASCYLWSTVMADALEEPVIDINVSSDDIIPSQPQAAPAVKRFPGWLALDFGTSNSTVTLFDPSEVQIAEILPKEQEKRLRERLAEWLGSSVGVALPEVTAYEWDKFIGEVSKNLEVEPQKLPDLLMSEDNLRFLEAIRQVELCLGNGEKFRRAISKKLYQIYHDVFRVPTLESQNLIPVVLDINRRSTEIPSELEIASLEDFEVRMGIEAQNRRKEAIAQGYSDSLKAIISRFHHSPKRYFGQERCLSVTMNGVEESVHVRELIQAAWAHLIDLTEDYRQRGERKFSEGEFCTAVVTYPTVAPPVMRKQVKELVEQLGIDDVQTAYDEAVSVAIFFLWREFGGNLNLGIESFKTRCRKFDNKWSQNVMVLDIGGGTTDLALIELILEDQTPVFADYESRGLGGRYYKLTPKLLGSSGHLQLGGELITLRVFRLLKVAIADFLLTAVTNSDVKSDYLEDLVTTELNESFLSQGKFSSGSLLRAIDKANPEGDAAYKDALDTADKVIPTRWQQAPQRLQTFYTLWEHAEAAKIKLGQKPPLASELLNYTISEQHIGELLTQSGIDFEITNPAAMGVTIDSEQFERATTSTIQEAIGIAKGLMESRLNPQLEDSRQNIHPGNTHKVDWLILSGKTCNLDLVQRHIYQEFSKSPYFVWNPERITFVLEFTKLATSAGACYGEKLSRLRFSPEESKALLRKGANQLEIDVKNLFYYLPCNFKRKTQSSELLAIFKTGQELYQINPKETIAKVRTEWQGIQLINIIYRQDYEGGELRLWGSFDGKNLMAKLGMTEAEFLENIKVQFEVDQNLQISILLCRGNPHYLIDGSGIDIGRALSGFSQTSGLFTEGRLIWNVAVERPKAQLNHGDIAVNVLESATVDKPHAYHLVFEVEREDYQLALEFHYQDGNISSPQRGLVSQPLPPFPQTNQHTFYIYQTDAQTNTKKWIRIGTLSKPSISTDYPCQYYVTLDSQGILRVHAGEVPYWTSSSNQLDLVDYLQQPGLVCRAALDLQPNEVDKERNPFCGVH